MADRNEDRLSESEYLQPYNLQFKAAVDKFNCANDKHSLLSITIDNSLVRKSGEQLESRLTNKN